MRNRLEQVYENELLYIRSLGAEFAKDRPKIADRLLLDRDKGDSEDPHVERLIQAFAFLNARTRLKLDDEFPELTDALLGILYPHYLAPIPSMSVVRFDLDPDQGKLGSGYTIPRKSRLYTRPVDGVRCQFRTAYPVTLWPIAVKSASYRVAPFGERIPSPQRGGAKALLKIDLCIRGGGRLADLELEKLRFFLSGDERTSHKLYEAIHNHVSEVAIQGDEGIAPLSYDADVLSPVGFEQDEGLLEYPRRSFVGYRLLTEYFTFPHKFLFVDVAGLRPLGALDGGTPGFDREFSLIFFLDRPFPELEPHVDESVFQLGCAPIVNLFEQRADPIDLTRTKSEYLLIPDSRHAGSKEVYSVDKVEGIDRKTKKTRPFEPFYSFRHHVNRHEERLYWTSHRRPSVRKDDAGTEVFLSLVDMGFQPGLPKEEVLTVETTCTNRDLPGQLRAAGGEQWEFYLEGKAPLRRIVPLITPTQTARLPDGHRRWRLISHLALNHLSITDEEDGGAALREILSLYDFAGSRVSHQHIQGIEAVKTRRAVVPIHEGPASGFCRGTEITLAMDMQKYVGSSYYLFASVLERFMGLYTSINSFAGLVVRSAENGDLLKRWPYRAGAKTVL